MVKRLVILASGEGTNLQHVIDNQGKELFNVKLIGVVSNKNSQAFLRSKNVNIPSYFCPWDKNESREDYDKNLGNLVSSLKPDIVFLLGWNHILSKVFLDKFVNIDILNLHPALPGTFVGNNAIEDTYNAFKKGELSQGDIGIMVHRVTEELDVGEVICKDYVDLEEKDTLSSLTSKFHVKEKVVVYDALFKLSTGFMFSGKVKDIYQISDDKMLIAHTDRLSAHNKVICEVDYKGSMLANLSKWWFDKTKHIIDNHVIRQDNHAMLVKKCTLIPVEFIVRSYITGSLWKHYSKGNRTYCGVVFNDDLRKNQKLDGEIITPTTKDEFDLPISYEDILQRNLLNKEDLDYIYSICIKLFNLGAEVAESNNLILVDTKYEFGRDINGKIILIDEIHTIESSRYWVKDTYEQNMKDNKEPDKLDKDNLRDFLVNSQKQNDTYQVPNEIKDKIIGCYKKVYENISGENVNLEVLKPYRNVILKDMLDFYNNLNEENYKIVIIAGSVKDNNHVNSIKTELAKNNLQYTSHVYSAHKNTSAVLDLLNQYKKLSSRIIYITVAGRSNALSGVVACNSDSVVIACPPIKDTGFLININSTLQMPSGTPVLTILDPNNVGLACKRILNLKG